MEHEHYNHVIIIKNNTICMIIYMYGEREYIHYSFQSTENKTPKV